MYAEVPAGLPLVQHALLTLFEHVRAGTFSVETVVEKTAHAPARLFGITERGFIREGYWADLVLVDPTTPTSERRDLFQVWVEPVQRHRVRVTSAHDVGQRSAAIPGRRPADRFRAAGRWSSNDHEQEEQGARRHR